MGHVSKIRCVNIPGTDLHYPYAFHVFIPTNASSFTMFHPWIFPPTMPLGHCIEPHPCSQEAVPISRFTTSVCPVFLARSKDVLPGKQSWDSKWPFPISLPWITVQTAEFDVWKQCAESAVSFFSFGSHGCQRHLWTLNISKPFFFNKHTPQNHGSWISRVLWRREPEMINPVKSHAEVETKLKNLKNMS